ncbi:MAG TPA: hypothetical protein VGJ81_21275 [Thermoanaerobaculia bacterium]|jgi:hypothetical protein
MTALKAEPEKEPKLAEVAAKLGISDKQLRLIVQHQKEAAEHDAPNRKRRRSPRSKTRR